MFQYCNRTTDMCSDVICEHLFVTDRNRIQLFYIIITFNMSGSLYEFFLRCLSWFEIQLERVTSVEKPVLLVLFA